MALLRHTPVSPSLPSTSSLTQGPTCTPLEHSIKQRPREQDSKQRLNFHSKLESCSSVRHQGPQFRGSMQRSQIQGLQLQTSKQIRGSSRRRAFHLSRGSQPDGPSRPCRAQTGKVQTLCCRLEAASAPEPQKAHRLFNGLQTRRVQLSAVAAEAPASTDTATPFLQDFQVQGVGFKPPGSPTWLLKDVSLSLPHSSLGLIYGRSGSGKTTLLQVLSGLSSATCGSISMAEEGGRTGAQGAEQPGGSGTHMRSLSRKEVAQRAGIVFQFPERYFLTDSLMSELTFGWPKRMEDMPIRLRLASRVQAALAAVGLLGVPLDTNPRALSGGNQRRLALAIQLVRLPELLLLDEPLAGLDWSAREDVVGLLRDLKKHCAVLVVSHDLRELTPLVDKSWHMRVGGDLQEEPLPSSFLVSDDEE